MNKTEKKRRKAARLHDLYLQHGSVEKAANAYEGGISRQAAWSLMKRYGFELSPRKPPKTTRMFQGKKYSKNKDGYWRLTNSRSNAAGELLHHAVWIEKNGSIPDGMQIVFLDGNRDNVDPRNLKAMTLRDAVHHANELYRARAIQLKDCPVCKKPMKPHEGESPSAYNKRQTCGQSCGRLWIRQRSFKGELRKCEWCGVVIAPTIYKGGARESISRYRKRRTCSTKCGGHLRMAGKRGESVSPETQCIFCGSRALRGKRVKRGEPEFWYKCQGSDCMLDFREVPSA